MQKSHHLKLKCDPDASSDHESNDSCMWHRGATGASPAKFHETHNSPTRVTVLGNTSKLSQQSTLTAKLESLGDSCLQATTSTGNRFYRCSQPNHNSFRTHSDSS